MSIEDKVLELVEDKIADRLDLFVVDISMSKSGLLSILIDGDQGVAIEDCVQISRHVGFHLEEDNVIDHAYRLEVSSPGVDYPLQTVRQYKKNIGRNVKISTRAGEKLEGKLVDANGASIVLEQKVKEKGKKAVSENKELTFEEIKETKVLISFK